MRPRMLLNHLPTSKLLPGLIAFVFLFLLAEQSTAQHTRYVKPGGTGDGSSWAQASSDLQAMINSLDAGGDIWVARGTYKPNRKANAPNTVTPHNRDNAFVLRAYVKIYGGFNGSETKLEQRNPDVNVTVLSGDFNGNDIPGNLSTYSENAYHVVVFGAEYALGMLLDGLTIRGGNANGTGSITVNTRPISRSHGGGIYISEVSPGLTHLTVMNNAASDRGGGIYSEAFSSNIMHATIRGNRATNGGGIYIRSNTYSDLSYLVIRDNIGTHDGGGLYSYNSSPTLTNSLIIGNEATNNMGGGLYFSASMPVLTNVTISRNKAKQGAGMANDTRPKGTYLVTTMLGTKEDGNVEKKEATVNMVLWTPAKDDEGQRYRSSTSFPVNKTPLIHK
ncbi:right-handed parallel beta-helix repeat-containing protein [Pontibacter sp. HSC-14F20]|uniref:right-handed parallel beta-helix repeat-containing protein n=1 Tax=Pontibacter sp. HSC-14F20 TaxID=2864136 RepID=UPI001C72D98B|nr:right-handed parallel beta-helix repeat-containing protein [Pontibacter sp. HSC-14F20]MBX0335470.1 right-handed parallel beta-helix repeat-containing protein [Pontibacter sp. HSC-14F20]